MTPTYLEPKRQLMNDLQIPGNTKYNIHRKANAHHMSPKMYVMGF